MVPKWLFHAPESVSASATVVDGIIYVGDWGGTFYAIDAASGNTLWTFTVDDTHEIGFGRIVSTAAVEGVRIPGAGTKKVVLFGGGGTLYALEAGRSGPHLLAKVDTDPRTQKLRDKQKDDPPQVEIDHSIWCQRMRRDAWAKRLQEGDQRRQDLAITFGICRAVHGVRTAHGCLT